MKYLLRLAPFCALLMLGGCYPYPYHDGERGGYYRDDYHHGGYYHDDYDHNRQGNSHDDRGDWDGHDHDNHDDYHHDE